MENELEQQAALQRDWTSLPTVLLVAVFSDLTTFATAHPDYLKQKAQAVSTLRRVCKAWHAAIDETPIGVCLPAHLTASARKFVSSITLRGIEFHDPERTHPVVIQLLSNTQLIAKSGNSLQSIIDAPFDGVWKPSDFLNITQLVVWRYGKTSSTWDVACISQLKQLNYLVLASGFKAMKRMHQWPASCKHLVWTSPAESHSSRLTVPAIPKHINLHWMSLRAYAVRLQDPLSLLGKVLELTIHAAYIFTRLPRFCYASLNLHPVKLIDDGSTETEMPVGNADNLSDAAPSPSVSPRPELQSDSDTSSPANRRSRGVRLSDNWPEEGLQAFASAFVEEHTLVNFRLKMVRMLISHPLEHTVGDESSSSDSGDAAQGADTEDDDGSDAGSSVSSGDEAEVVQEGLNNGTEGTSNGQQSQPTQGRRACRSCGRQRPDGGGDGSDSESDTSEIDDLKYDEVTPDQVQNAFKVAIARYKESVAARTITAPAINPYPEKPREVPGIGTCTCRGTFDAPAAFVVPKLETGKNTPGQERELTITRKYADPREPARLKLDQPDGPTDMTLSTQLPLLLASKRPIQAVSFAPWPYRADVLDSLTNQVQSMKISDTAVVTQDNNHVIGQISTDHPHVVAIEENTTLLQDSHLQLPDDNVPAQSPASPATDSHGTSTHTQQQQPQMDEVQLVNHACEQQMSLLSDPRTVATSAIQLRKVNNLLIASIMGPERVKTLLAPYSQLTKVSIILNNPDAAFDTPIFPVSVVKVGVYASRPNQRFHAGLVSNLTEMWRLTLVGFHSFDLAALPSVRPGFILKITDVPGSRQEPIGRPAIDKLMPQGHIIDLNVQIGTDKLPEAEETIPIARVHLGAWSGLCKDLHVRCPSGAELYTGARTVPDIFRQLTNAGITQFTVCLALQADGAIAAIGPEAQEALQNNGHGHVPVFAFILSNGSRFHGMSLAMLVKEGVFPGWAIEVMDSSAIEHEPGMLYITFYRNSEPETAPPPTAAIATLMEMLD